MEVARPSSRVEIVAAMRTVRVRLLLWIYSNLHLLVRWFMYQLSWISFFRTTENCHMLYIRVATCWKTRKSQEF